MYRKIYDLTYVLSVVIQGFWSLLFPIGVGLLGGWLLVNKVGAPSWLMIALTTAGVFVGLISMCKFLMSAMTALERRDKERAEAERKRRSEEVAGAEAERQRKNEDKNEDKNENKNEENINGGYSAALSEKEVKDNEK